MLAWQVLYSAFTSPTYTMRPAPALPAATEHSPGLGPGPEIPGMKELMMELFSEPLVVTYLYGHQQSKSLLVLQSTDLASPLCIPHL